MLQLQIKEQKFSIQMLFSKHSMMYDTTQLCNSSKNTILFNWAENL